MLWRGEYGGFARVRVSAGEAFVESADSSGNIRVYSHKIVGLYCTLKTAACRAPHDKRRRSFAARVSLSLRLLDRACRVSRRDRFIHFACCPSAARARARLCNNALFRSSSFKADSAQNAIRYAPSCRLATLNAIHSTFCQDNMWHLFMYNLSNLHKAYLHACNIRSIALASLVHNSNSCADYL